MTRPRQQEQELGDRRGGAIDHVPWVESIREGCWAATRATAPVNLLEASILMKRTMGQMDGWRRAVVWMKFEGRGIGAGRNEFVWLEEDEGAGFPPPGGVSGPPGCPAAGAGNQPAGARASTGQLWGNNTMAQKRIKRDPDGPIIGTETSLRRGRRANESTLPLPLLPRSGGDGELVDTSGEGSKGNGKRTPQVKQWLQHRIQPSFHVEAASHDAARREKEHRGRKFVPG